MITCRGYLTEDFAKEAKEFLGRDLAVTELRLYPYLTSCMLDRDGLDSNKISIDERDIINMLSEEGHIAVDMSLHIYPTEEFYMFMQKALFNSYVISKGNHLFSLAKGD